MKDDPFLRDAVEGFQDHPQAFSSLKKIKRRTDKRLGVRNSWKSYAVWTLGAAALTIGAVGIILNLRSDMVEQIAESDRELRETQKPIEDKRTVEPNEKPDSLVSAVYTSQGTDSSIQVVVAIENRQIFQDEFFVSGI